MEKIQIEQKSRSKAKSTQVQSSHEVDCTILQKYNHKVPTEDDTDQYAMRLTILVEPETYKRLIWRKKKNNLNYLYEGMTFNQRSSHPKTDHDGNNVGWGLVLNQTTGNA